MFVLELGKAAVLKSWHGEDYFLQTLNEGDCFGEMAVMDHCPRSASVRAVEDYIAIHISAAHLYQVYAQDLKQFALIQMNSLQDRNGTTVSVAAVGSNCGETSRGSVTLRARPSKVAPCSMASEQLLMSPST